MPESTDILSVSDDAEPYLQEFGIRLKPSEDQRTLLAEFTPQDGQSVLDRETLDYLLEAAGYDPSLLFETEVDTLIQQQRKRQACELEIGGARDAQIDVFLSQDKLLAGIRITPAQGNGAPADSEKLSQALKEAGIVQGLQDAALEQAIEEQAEGSASEECCYLVAYGKPAREGQAAILEPLVQDASDRRPLVRENDRIDFFDQGDFPTVTEGTPLVRRHPPTPCENGYTVTGQELVPEPPHDFMLLAKEKGTRVSADDPNVLEASIEGLPVILPYGAKVENILKLDAVDLSSGHVRFDGSVQIKDGVYPGMKVEVTGDVQIGGTVEGARVEAEGDIHIKGGVLGHTPLRDEAGNPGPEAAVIQAGGNLEANFIQHAIVECQGQVRVKKLIMHSELTAKGSVKLARNGQIIGGHTVAGPLIEADQLGSSAGVKTVLEVGPADDLRQQMEACSQRQDTFAEQLDQLKTVLARLKRSGKQLPPEKAHKYKQAWHQLHEARTEQERLYRQLEAILLERREARIRAGRTIYASCQLIIAGQSRILNNELGKATFRLMGNEIKVQ